MIFFVPSHSFLKNITFLDCAASRAMMIYDSISPIQKPKFKLEIKKKNSNKKKASNNEANMLILLGV